MTKLLSILAIIFIAFLFALACWQYNEFQSQRAVYETAIARLHQRFQTDVREERWADAWEAMSENCQDQLIQDVLHAIKIHEESTGEAFSNKESSLPVDAYLPVKIRQDPKILSMIFRYLGHSQVGSRKLSSPTVAFDFKTGRAVETYGPNGSQQRTIQFVRDRDRGWLVDAVAK